MKSTDAPSKQAVPFGTNGPRESITATTPSGSNQASYDQGFPPITMTLKSAGGLPPKGQDMNQILFEQSSFNRYFSAGGGYVYDSTFSTAVGGYPLSARIPNSTGTGFWFNTVEDNQTNPENSTSSLTGWIPMGSYGVTALTGLTSASVTLTTLQASKDRITLAGTLTTNINIVVPAWIKRWEIVNNCTGSFSVTIKTPSGTGVAVPASSNAFVFGDGTNIVTSLPPGVLLKVTVITSSGTFSPQSYTKSMVVECVGGGGGGGGCVALSTGAHSVGGAGGAGGTAKSLITSVATSYPVTIGIAGLAGTSTGTNATDGGTTSFGTSVVATGGAGGATSTASAISSSNAVVAAGGNAGKGTTGNLSTGSYESAGVSVAAFASNIGAGGGSTPYGTGGVRVGTSIQGSVAGNNASGYGAGGGAAVAYAASSATTAVAGGSGTPGIIIVWEYS